MTQDTILLDRYVADGDRAALEELFARHYPAVRRSILHMVHDGFDADDLAQATFLKAVRKSASYSGAGSFRGWLLAIAVNEVRDFRRGKKRRREDALFDLYQSTDPAADVPATGMRREFEQKLERALEGLSPELKDPLVLHYYEGLSFAEVAELLGVPKSTAATRVGSAVKRLKRAFAQRGWLALLPTFDRVLEPIGAAADTVAAGAGVGAKSTASGDWLKRLRQWFDNSRLSGPFGVVVAMAIAIATVLGLGFAEWFGSEPVPSGVGDRVAAGSDGAAAAPAAGTRSEEVARAAATGVDRVAMVQGRVIDGLTGYAVAGAMVVLHDYRDGEDLQASSDEEGLFAFPATVGRSDAFALAIATPHHARRLHESVCASREPQRYVVTAGRHVAGRVVDAEGQPVVRYRIVAIRRPVVDEILPLTGAVPGAMRVDASAEVVSSLGEFVLSGLAPVPVDLVVEVPGEAPWLYHQEEGLLPGEPEANELTLTMPRAVDIEVDVRDRETGEPIADATVAVQRYVGGWRERFAVPVRAGDRPGRFLLRRWTVLRRYNSISGAGAKIVERLELHMSVSVSAPGYSSMSYPREQVTASRAYVYELSRAGRIEGRVLADDGTALAHARVVVKTDVWFERLLVTDEQGRFEIDPATTDGDLQLTAIAPDHGGRRSMTEVSLRPGETRYVVLGGPQRSARGFGTLAGSMKAFGEPVRGVNVRAARGESAVVTLTDDAGAFRIDGLAPGSYEISFWPDDEAGQNGLVPNGVRSIEIGPGRLARLDVDVQIRIAGRVLDAATGEPAHEARVRARRVGSDLAFEADSDAAGRFELAVPESGAYQFELGWSDVWLPHRMPVVNVSTASAPRAIEVLVAKDPQDGLLELEVVDATTGETVTTGLWHFETEEFNATGRLSHGVNDVEQLAVASYRMQVHSDEHVPVAFDFVIHQPHERLQRRVELVRATRLECVGGGTEAPHPGGLLPGDRVLSWGPHAVTSLGDLRQAHAAIGESAAPMRIWRAGAEIVLPVHRRQLPALEGGGLFSHDFDARLQNR